MAVLPLWFSISGSTTISCSSYDSGGVVAVTCTDCRTDAVSGGSPPPSTTMTVAAGRDRELLVTAADCSRDRIALGGGFKVVAVAVAPVAMAEGSTTDKVASVLAAMAAGGGAAVTIGPPETTGEATALVAWVVAMAVAEVDAVTGDTPIAVTGVVIVDVGAVTAAVVTVGAVGSEDDVDCWTDVASIFVVVVVAVPSVITVVVTLSTAAA